MRRPDQPDRVGAIGTPDDAIAQIRRLEAQSAGGFGCFLHLAHDWAAPAARFRSYELFARHVAPHFQGQFQSTTDARTRAVALHAQRQGSLQISWQ